MEAYSGKGDKASLFPHWQVKEGRAHMCMGLPEGVHLSCPRLWIASLAFQVTVAREDTAGKGSDQWFQYCLVGSVPVHLGCPQHIRGACLIALRQPLAAPEPVLDWAA